MVNYEALFKVSYGMYIVSSGNKQSGNGFIANSVFQITAEPPVFAVSCNKDNYTAEVINSVKAFAISILNQNTPVKLIGKFGYKSGNNVDKLKDSRIDYGLTGVPIITDEAIAFIECKLIDTIDIKTHYLFIGEVVQSNQLSDEVPLTYAFYREVKKGLSPKNAPTYIDKSKLREKNPLRNNKKFKCLVCGYVYDSEKGDPGNGINPGTPFNEIPPKWGCPVCGAGTDDFVEL